MWGRNRLTLLTGAKPMAERKPTRKPTVVIGSNVYSGTPNTGEIHTTRGGVRASCVWSGSLLTNAALTGAAGAVQSGGHILLHTGAGRLNSVWQHQGVLSLSGVAITFYDAAAITASGVSVSGQRFIASVNAPQGQSGQFTAVAPVAWDIPFTSGLCASAPSGTPGFTVTFTPVVSGVQNIG